MKGGTPLQNISSQAAGSLKSNAGIRNPSISIRYYMLKEIPKLSAENTLLCPILSSFVL